MSQYKGCQRVHQFEESQTIALAKRVRQLRNEGKSILSFTLGELDFETPAHIKAEAIEAIHGGDTHYPPVAGTVALRTAIANHLQNYFHLSYEPDQVLVSNGAKQSLHNALYCLVERGDEVIIPTPYWVSYLPMVQIAEGIPVIVPTQQSNGLKLQPEELDYAITSKTRLLILNSPSNPSGVVYSQAEIEALAKVLLKHPHVFVISDEIYAHICYDGSFYSIGNIEALKGRVIIISGVSKAFAMTGWRIGYMAASQWLIQLAEKYQGQVTSGACTIAQRAALAALSQPIEPTIAIVHELKNRRDIAVQLLQEALPEIWYPKPTGSFYLYLDLAPYFGKKRPDGQPIESIEDLCLYLLDAVQVALVAGTGFGTKTHVRFSYACSVEQIEAGIRRMKEAFDQLH
jgi:aspartate aminotransferase